MKPEDVSALDDTPYLFFVLWDEVGDEKIPRCRVWAVRTQRDPVFRQIAQRWYDWRREKRIKSNNFQLHPPRNRDANTFRNTAGNLEYPLLFAAVRKRDKFELVTFNWEVMNTGECRPV